MPARSLPVDVAVGKPPTDSRLSLSNTMCTKFLGFNAPTVASVPIAINTLPSPSNTTTLRLGCARATPRPIAGAKPMEPII